jgi:hypothetical protein
MEQTHNTNRGKNMTTTERTVEDFLTVIFETARNQFKLDGDDLAVSEIFDEIVMADCDEEEGAISFVDPNVRVESFERAGVMTNNRGLVVKIGDSEFQITIVQSK